MNTTLEEFVARINDCTITPTASAAVRTHVLTMLRAFGRTITVHETEIAPQSLRYIARTMYRDPTGWSLSSVVFAPGQATLPHDHEGWGCATTIRGIESVRRFANPAGRKLVMIEGREVPPGDGHRFDRDEIHQVIGGDGRGPTLALHLLVQGTTADRAQQRFPERNPPDGWRVTGRWCGTGRQTGSGTSRVPFGQACARRDSAPSWGYPSSEDVQSIRVF